MKRVTAGVSLVACVACSQAPRASHPDVAAICEARAFIARTREASAARFTQNLRVTLSSEHAPAELAARGALSARRPSDLRMLLLGPGGSTAVDVLLDERGYRFAMPPLDRIVRGTWAEASATRRALPVDFLRWWLLRPLEGELVHAERRGLRLRLVLRDANTSIDLQIDDRGPVHGERLTFDERGVRVDRETLDASRFGCGAARYTQESSGLIADIACEREREGAADKAFVDPDAAGAP